MSAALEPSEHPWMIAKETVAVMEALEAGGGKARFVGGSVRNALLGQSVIDIDIATTLKPINAVAALKSAGIGVALTGVEHGTITAVANGKPFEVTTLRRDVSTDGRRATVAFTNDWAEDAARRDFTMNAIYADRKGHLYDPTGGIADLKAGRVRFVGDADARIREDYLRILRLFRFHAWYGRGEIDADAVVAAEKNRAGLKKLSGERTQKELLRLLEAENPLPSFQVMHTRHLSEQILPEPLRLERLASLIDIVRTQGIERPPILALAALLSTKEQARAVAADLRLSNADRERLTGALSADAELNPGMTRPELRRALYRFGAERTLDLLLLGWAGNPKLTGWEDLLHGVREWTHPEFPIDGRDALDAGLREGPGVGRALAAVERWWVDQDFGPGREALLAKLKELAR